MTASTHASESPAQVVGPSVSLSALLLGGSVLVFLTFMRFGLTELGWVVFAPFLVALHERGTRARHLAVLGALLVAVLAAVSKMATQEIPWAAVPLFALPVAASYFVALALAGAAHRRLGARWGVYTFASLTVWLGWVQYTFTSGSSWAVLAHTQLDNLPLIQLASLTGVGGITFLVALGSGLAAAVWSEGAGRMRIDLAAYAIALVAALLYGQLRLAEPNPGGQEVRIGGIVSPMTHVEFRQAMREVDAVRNLDAELFARSDRAVDLGAKVVVWDEIATMVSVDGEQALTARGRELAMQRGVLLLMAYGVVDTVQPFHYVNKYRIYLPDGTLPDEYVKRKPTPVDPNDPSTAHAGVVSFAGVSYGGAICYDYGFPEIARDNAIDGAQIALVPASDWRGIDPGHALMARMNAVAAGLPMVRPVRAATSIVTDAYGRMLGSMRADGDNDGVMVVAVPPGRVPTLYVRTGEVVPLFALAFCIVVAVLALRARRRHPGGQA